MRIKAMFKAFGNPFKQKSFWTIYSAMAALTILQVVASAADPEPLIPIETITTAVGQAVTDTLALMAGLLPIALSVFAMVWGVRKAMRFFKAASN